MVVSVAGIVYYVVAIGSVVIACLIQASKDGDRDA